MTDRTCVQCEHELAGRQRRFCSQRCDRRWRYTDAQRGPKRCDVQGCRNSVHAKGLCPMHYQRQRLRAGATGSSVPERAKHHRMVCAVAGCESPRRKREWCAAHYAQYQRIGTAKEFTRHWSPRMPCLVCGDDATLRTSGLRQFCSAACRALYQTYGGAVPDAVECVNCGNEIPLTRDRKSGYRKRVDTLMCGRCRRGTRKHGMSVPELVRRDGCNCGICRLPVDLTLRAPDPSCASVDHIRPKAAGGTNDPSNLQLAHLLCNVRKGHRVT